MLQVCSIHGTIFTVATSGHKCSLLFTRAAGASPPDRLATNLPMVNLAVSDGGENSPMNFGLRPDSRITIFQAFASPQHLRHWIIPVGIVRNFEKG